MNDPDDIIAGVRAEAASILAGLSDTALCEDADLARRAVADMVAGVKARYPAKRDQGAALLALRDHLDVLRHDQGLPLPAPRVLRPQKQSAPLRDAGWAQDARFAYACDAALTRTLGSRRLRAGTLPGLVIATAILRGGLLRPLGWVALWRLLRAGMVPLKRSAALPGLVWVDLPLPHRAPRMVTEAGGEGLRFFPDVVTLAMLGRWRAAVQAPMPDLTTPEAVLVQVCEALDIQQPPPSPERFATAAYAPLEERHPEVPQALWAVAAGDLEAYGAPSLIWESCWSGQRPMPRKDESTYDAPPEGQPTEEAQDSPDLNSLAQLAALHRAVHTRPDGAHKYTRAPVQAALQTVLANSPVPVIRALALWYLSLLALRRKVSTVQRYHASVAAPLVDLAGAENPATWAAYDLEELCVQAVQLHPPQQMAYDLGRFAQLCDFASKDPRLNWPAVQLDAPGPGKGPDRVRVGLVTGDDLRRGLEGIDQRSPPDQGAMYQVALLLMARGGLRIGEVEALTLADIADGELGVVTLHPTRFANLKSTSARRKLPLRALCRGEEAQIWDRFVQQRRQEAATQDAFVARPASLFESTRFDRLLFADMLRRVVRLRPHDLRHGALSNLALCLMAPVTANRAVQRVTGWPKAQQERLRTLFVGTDPRRISPQIARLAGHRDPATSFAHYLHLSDLALGLHLRHSATSHPRADVTRMLALNRTSLSNRSKMIRPEALRKVVLRKLPVQIVQPAAPVSAALPPPVPEITIDLITRVIAGLRAGTSAAELVHRFVLPEPVITYIVKSSADMTFPRRSETRALALKIAQTVLTNPPDVARAWALQTLAHPKSGARFTSPKRAAVWVAPISKARITWRRTLTLPPKTDPSPWASFAPRIIERGNTRKATLTLTPLTPKGPATPALKHAAKLIKITLTAREIWEKTKIPKAQKCVK